MTVTVRVAPLGPVPLASTVSAEAVAPSRAGRRRRPRMSGRPSGERGSATVWVLALSAVLAVVGAATVLVGCRGGRPAPRGRGGRSRGPRGGRPGRRRRPCRVRLARRTWRRRTRPRSRPAGCADAVVEVRSASPWTSSRSGSGCASARPAGPLPPADQRRRAPGRPPAECRPADPTAPEPTARSSAGSSAAASSTGAPRPRPARRAPRRAPARRPALSSGSLPLPHLGDCTQDGQPLSHSQLATVARVACSHRRSTAKPRSLKPAPPGWPS